MADTVPFMLLCYAVCLCGLCWKFPASTVALTGYLLGWVMLPVAVFDTAAIEDLVDFPVMGLALPGAGLISKAAVLGGAAALAVFVFDFKTVLRFRPRLTDGFAVLLVITPIAAALFNSTSVIDGLIDTIYLDLAWTGPYLLGRLYLSDAEGHHRLLKAFMFAALLTLPLCLLEFFIGPSLYGWVYGPHPYAQTGAARYFGYRPMLFMEDGNQLAMWLAGGAVAASALRFAGTRRIGLVPVTIAALMLVAMTLLTQSIGAIILMVFALAWLFVIDRVSPRWLLFPLLSLVLVYGGMRATGQINAQKFVENTPIGPKVKQLFKDAGRGSFGWRLKHEETHLPIAMEKPVLGHGSPTWWEGDPPGRPWSLWTLALGAYGFVGLGAMVLTLMGPAVWWQMKLTYHHRATHRARCTGALCALLMIAAIDAMLNSALLLPWLMASGALVGAKPGDEAARQSV